MYGKGSGPEGPCMVWWEVGGRGKSSSCQGALVKQTPEFTLIFWVFIFTFRSRRTCTTNARIYVNFRLERIILRLRFHQGARTRSAQRHYVPRERGELPGAPVHPLRPQRVFRRHATDQVGRQGRRHD